MWTCPHCDATVDSGFDVCWQCGTARDGTEDPNFETADESGPIADPVEDGMKGEMDELVDEFDEPFPELVECYAAQDPIEARFIADQLRAIGIPAVSDRISVQQGALAGMVVSALPRVRVRPEDLTRARTWIAGYERNLRDRHEARG